MSVITLDPASSKDLSWLNGMAQGAISAAGEHAKGELEGFGWIPKDRYESVHGFRMQGVEATRRSLKGIVEVVEHAAKASGFCKEIGITPLAIVPTTAWKGVCVKAGLFTLRPTADSMVRVSLKMLSEAISRIKLAGPKSSPPRSWFSRLHSQEDDVRTRLDTELRALSEEAGVVKEYFARFGSREIIQELFPGYVEPERDGHRTKVLFPEPPATVGKVLYRLTQKVLLSVTLQWEALSFPELEPELLVGISRRITHATDQAEKAIADIQAAAERQRAEHERLAVLRSQRELEPIITFEVGRVTVLAAQYGPWVIEECVVEECIRESLRAD